MKPTKAELIEKYGKENVDNWDEGVEVDKLYDEYEDIYNKGKRLIQFDPSSNKPFIVSFKVNGEWEIYSGENTLREARDALKGGYWRK